MRDEVTKSCIACGEILPLQKFYKHPQMADGRLNKCKECVKQYQRTRPYSKEYERFRNQLPHRVAARKLYSKSDKGKAAAARANAAYRERSNVKRKARDSVRNAIRDGRLDRPTECSHCFRECTPHGHHEDYNKPLDVVWLCAECHRNLHAFYETVGHVIPGSELDDSGDQAA